MDGYLRGKFRLVGGVAPCAGHKALTSTEYRRRTCDNPRWGAQARRCQIAYTHGPATSNKPLNCVVAACGFRVLSSEPPGTREKAQHQLLNQQLTSRGGSGMQLIFS